MSRRLQITDVDGIPTFFVETGQTPYACLKFRVGCADEALPSHGWTHVLEHVAMHAVTNARVTANASVGLWTTEFHVTGEASDVVSFMAGLARWLSAPDFTALADERSILEAEAQQRSHSSLGEHLDYRFGARGVGLLNYPELGLRTANEHVLSHWSNRWFTWRNASMAMNCAPPPGLSVVLPEGVRASVPEAVSIIDEGPQHAAGGSLLTVASGLVSDSVLSNLVGGVLSEALTAGLRHQQRVSYGTTAAVERVDSHQLMLQLTTDIVRDRRHDGVRLVSDVVRRLADRGVDPQQIDHARNHIVRFLRDDSTGMWQAPSAANAVLRGAAPSTEQDLLDRHEAVTAHEVNAQVREFAQSMLLTSPSGEKSITQIPFTRGAPSLSVPADAQTYRCGLAPADKRSLHVNEDVAVISEADKGVQDGVEVRDAAALLVYPDGARTVISRHGTALHLEPRSWRSGSGATAQLDALVPSSAHIMMPARSQAEIPGALTRRQWLRAQVLASAQRHQLVAYVVIALLIGIVAGGISGVINLITGHNGPLTAASIERQLDRQISDAAGTDVEVNCAGATARPGETIYCTILKNGVVVRPVKVKLLHDRTLEWHTL